MQLRILLADDHSVVRRGLRFLLESRKGWKVCAEAGDGRAAVAAEEPELCLRGLLTRGSWAGRPFVCW